MLAFLSFFYGILMVEAEISHLNVLQVFRHTDILWDGSERADHK